MSKYLGTSNLAQSVVSQRLGPFMKGQLNKTIRKAKIKSDQCSLLWYLSQITGNSWCTEWRTMNCLKTVLEAGQKSLCQGTTEKATKSGSKVKLPAQSLSQLF